MLQELQKNFHLLQRTAISTKLFGVLSNFYLMISIKYKLRPYHMHVKLIIIIHCIKLSSEVTHPVATKRKNGAYLPACSSFCQNFVILGMLGCVVMSPD